jgi:Na+/proline symporter
MTDINDKRIAIARRLAIFAVIVWFVAAFIAGLAGIINEPNRPPLLLASFISVPIIGFIAAYILSASFRAFTKSLSLTLIVASHLWRFVGVGL